MSPSTILQCLTVFFVYADTACRTCGAVIFRWRNTLNKDCRGGTDHCLSVAATDPANQHPAAATVIRSLSQRQISDGRRRAFGNNAAVNFSSGAPPEPVFDVLWLVWSRNNLQKGNRPVRTRSKRTKLTGRMLGSQKIQRTIG